MGAQLFGQPAYCRLGGQINGEGRGSERLARGCKEADRQFQWSYLLSAPLSGSSRSIGSVAIKSLNTASFASSTGVLSSLGLRCSPEAPSSSSFSRDIPADSRTLSSTKIGTSARIAR